MCSSFHNQNLKPSTPELEVADEWSNNTLDTGNAVLFVVLGLGKFVCKFTLLLSINV